MSGRGGREGNDSLLCLRIIHQRLGSRSGPKVNLAILHLVQQWEEVCLCLLMLHDPNQQNFQHLKYALSAGFSPVTSIWKGCLKCNTTREALYWPWHLRCPYYALLEIIAQRRDVLHTLGTIDRLLPRSPCRSPSRWCAMDNTSLTNC